MGAGAQFGLRAHRQGEEVEQGVEISLLAEVFQAQPLDLVGEHLQLAGRLGWAEFQAPVGQHHENDRVLDLGMLPQKTKTLGCKPMLESRLA